MNIEKAIELSIIFTALPFDANLEDTRYAIKMGTEGLLKIRRDRAMSQDAPEQLLPGEEL